MCLGKAPLPSYAGVGKRAEAGCSCEVELGDRFTVSFEGVMVRVHGWGVGSMILAGAGSKCFGFGSTDDVGDGETVFAEWLTAGDFGHVG
mmetsp:Transcript_8527/g.16444  ORF Transcript_8527/g.16444 Transcript_8527/m.16444 type:complete len:90 (+) Transcript_8527:997-1266(+)